MSVAPIKVGDTDKTLQGVAYVVSGGLITGVKTDLVVADIDSLYVIRDQSTAVTISSDGTGLTNKTNQNDAHSDGAVWNPGDGTLFVDIPDAAVAVYAKDVQLKGAWTDGSDSGVIRGTPVSMVNYSWSNGTGGANTVTITVDDDSDNLLANAVVELLSGNSLVDRQTTNGSGVATLNADDGTYTLRVSVPTGGYSSSTNTSFSVSGATSGSVELTALAPTPSSVGYVTGYLYTDVDGVRTGNTSVTLTIVGRPTSGNNSTGLAVDDNRTITSDGDGYAEWTNLVSGAKYRVSYAGVTVDTTIPADATGSVPLNTIVGDGV